MWQFLLEKLYMSALRLHLKTNKKLLVVKNTTTYTEFMLKTALQPRGFSSGHKYELWHHVCNATNIRNSAHTYVYMTFVTRHDFWNKIIQWRHWALDYPVDVSTCQNTNDHMTNQMVCYRQVQIFHVAPKLFYVFLKRIMIII